MEYWNFQRIIYENITIILIIEELERGIHPRKKTVTDMLGRTIRIERPGFLNVEAEESFYNAKGQLIKTVTSIQADTLYEYDDRGAQVRSGLDMNKNVTLVVS
jgi:hypothetical protein